MTIGELVDFVIAYNERQEQAQKEMEKTEKRGARRKATQSDINAFFG